MSLRTLVLAAVASVATISAANAVPISGQISLGGYALANGSASMGMATGISFANASGTSVTGTGGLLTSYGAGTGTFATLGACANAIAGCGTISNISNFATSGPISQFLTLATTNGATVSFDLTTIGTRTYTQDASGGSLVFNATGMINYSGYESTTGVFTLTAQGNQITSFSATTLATTAIPEPLSLSLLGGSLAIVGLIRRKRI